MFEKMSDLRRSTTIGVVAGLRSQLPLALLALADRQYAGDGRALPGRLGTPAVTALLVASAAGEIIVDKLPFVPSRLMPGSLVFRTGIGGVAGALIARHDGASPIPGAVCGAVGALAGSYSGYHLRAKLVEVSGLPDPLIAVAEDVTAISLGSRAAGLQARPHKG